MWLVNIWKCSAKTVKFSATETVKLNILYIQVLQTENSDQNRACPKCEGVWFSANGKWNNNRKSYENSLRNYKLTDNRSGMEV